MDYLRQEVTRIALLGTERVELSADFLRLCRQELNLTTEGKSHATIVLEVLAVLSLVQKVERLGTLCE